MLDMSLIEIQGNIKQPPTTYTIFNAATAT